MISVLNGPFVDWEFFFLTGPAVSGEELICHGYLPFEKCHKNYHWKEATV